MQMAEPFKLIVITSPSDVPEEDRKITRLLDAAGVDYVHIRKPGWTEEQVENLILKIPATYRGRIKLNDYHNLASMYGLGGVHLNGRNPHYPDFDTKISKSCHTLREIDECTGEKYEYKFLSPIYDSISKPGYGSAFVLDEISNHIRNKDVVALGGVNIDRLQELRDAGFAGAAMLGEIWQSSDFDKILELLKAIRICFNT